MSLSVEEIVEENIELIDENEDLFEKLEEAQREEKYLKQIIEEMQIEMRNYYEVLEKNEELENYRLELTLMCLK